MLYSEAEVPTVAGMNGKVTAYGKSGGFLESLIFSFSQRPRTEKAPFPSFILAIRGSAQLSSA